jgi:hypothetical protein
VIHYRSFHFMAPGGLVACLTKLDPNDPESLSKVLRQTSPDLANDSIRKAIIFGWWLLPKDQRTEENLEREIRRLVDDAIRGFREDKDRFLRGEDPFSSPSKMILARDLLLKAGRKRFGPPDDRIRDRITATTDAERLRHLFERLSDVTTWDDLMAET